MSDKPAPQSQPPIAFGSLPIDQQPNSVPPSMNNFPSTSQFNDPLPQQQSFASINYNDEPPNQLVSEKSINQEEQVEELKKISKEKNQIDEDEILRMFREEQNKMQKTKKQDERKKQQTPTLAPGQKDKKSTLHHSGRKQTQVQGEQIHRKRQAPEQQSLPFISKTTSIKQLRQPQGNTTYANLSSSELVRQLLLQYKIQYRASVYDPDWQKERYKIKEQVFEQLCIGVQEMRQKPQNQLGKQESEVLQKVSQISSLVSKSPYDFGVFKYCRNIVIELDLEMFIHFHQKSKQPLSKDYKAQYKLLVNNLKDPENYELRKKILTHQMDPDTIKLANQIDFFTETKRNQIKSKEQKLLKQFSVDHERTLLKSQFQNQNLQNKNTQNLKQNSDLSPSDAKLQSQAAQVQANHQGNINQQLGEAKQELPDQQQDHSVSNILAYNKYVEESTLLQLEQLLSEGQIQKMRTRLAEDLKGPTQSRMLSKFDAMIIGRF